MSMPDDEIQPPRIWWSPSNSSLYCLFSDEVLMRSACEPGHEEWTGLRSVPDDAIVLVRPAAPSPAAIERAARAADESFHAQAGYFDDLEARGEFWRNVASAVATALAAEDPQEVDDAASDVGGLDA